VRVGVGYREENEKEAETEGEVHTTVGRWIPYDMHGMVTSMSFRNHSFSLTTGAQVVIVTNKAATSFVRNVQCCRRKRREDGTLTDI
jgi:hypothetical protein